MTSPAPVQTNPVGAGIVISGAVKTVLLALVAVGVLPLTGDQIAAIVLAVSSLADVGIYFGFIRPRLATATEQRATVMANEYIDRAQTLATLQDQTARIPTRVRLPAPERPLIDPPRPAQHRWDIP